MPGPLDGLVAAHAIVKSQQGQSIPVITVSPIADSILAGLLRIDEHLPMPGPASRSSPAGCKYVERLLHARAA